MAKKKLKPHRAIRRDVSEEQAMVLAHLLQWGEPGLRHVHPQAGMQGEVQAIAFGITTEGEQVVRLDRIPSIDGVPFRVILLDVFPEFPSCLELIPKGWTPASYFSTPEVN